MTLLLPCAGMRTCRSHTRSPSVAEIKSRRVIRETRLTGPLLPFGRERKKKYRPPPLLILPWTGGLPRWSTV
eukprot:2899776-Lingulodinium_polyedra.AAC.1